jgi:hypothetical protein
MGGAFGQFTVRKEHLAHTQQPKTLTAWFLMLSNGWGKIICDGIWTCTAVFRTCHLGEQARVYGKRNLHQIERGKWKNDLRLMFISSHTFFCLACGP